MLHCTTLIIALGVCLGQAQPEQAATAAPLQQADWGQYNFDNRGWRFNPAETRLTVDNVHGLVEKWRFPAKDSDKIVGAVHATPVVVNGFVYFGTARPGVFYTLSPRGELVWEYPVVTVPMKIDNPPSTESGLLSWSIKHSPPNIHENFQKNSGPSRDSRRLMGIGIQLGLTESITSRIEDK